MTPEGARLLPMAESILHDLERLEHQAGVPHGRKEELRLGAGDALGRRLLPRALAKLLGESPSIDVRLREGNGQMLIDSLREGEIDLALIVAPDGESSVPAFRLSRCLVLRSLCSAHLTGSPPLNRRDLSTVR